MKTIFTLFMYTTASLATRFFGPKSTSVAGPATGSELTDETRRYDIEDLILPQ